MVKNIEHPYYFRAALLGVGISHSSLTKLAELLKLESGTGPSNVATKFSAGELRWVSMNNEWVRYQSGFTSEI